MPIRTPGRRPSRVAAAAFLLLLCSVVAAGDDARHADKYAGKYEHDPRMAAIRQRLPELRARALRRIGEVLGRTLLDRYLVRILDSDRDRSGLWAEVLTRPVQGKRRPVLVLRSEHLVLGTHDLEKTLIHEFYHCLQRDRLGETAHLRTPKWAREGAALYVAGQAEERTRILAAALGADLEIEDPLARLVDGLDDHHGLGDYAEDVCAFLAAEERYGKARVVVFLRRLLETSDVNRAIGEVFSEDAATFRRKTEAFARIYIARFLEPGRKRIRAAKRRFLDRDYAGALQLLKPVGAYAPVAAYYRALALHRLGRDTAALGVLRHGSFCRSTLVDDALLLELRLLKALRHPDFPRAARRARLDLAPFPVYETTLEVIAGRR